MMSLLSSSSLRSPHPNVTETFSPIAPSSHHPSRLNARPQSSKATAMQWLIAFYCALMGAVQYYTLLPVGCDLASSHCNLKSVPVYTLTSLASAPWMPKFPLLDAPPVLLLLDGVPTCLPPPATHLVAKTALEIGTKKLQNLFSTVIRATSRVPGQFVRTSAPDCSDECSTTVSSISFINA